MKARVVKFLQFLEAKEGKNAPLKFKLMNPDKFAFSKDELIVDEGLDLSATNITTLPMELHVAWDLNLSNCTSLKSLHNGLEIGGFLDLDGCTSLKTLPNNLRVGLGLILSGCTLLRALPNRLEVGTNLYLDRTPIAAMYSEDEVRAMIEAKGGYVGKNIHMTDY